MVKILILTFDWTFILLNTIWWSFFFFSLFELFKNFFLSTKNSFIAIHALFCICFGYVYKKNFWATSALVLNTDPWVSSRFNKKYSSSIHISLNCWNRLVYTCNSIIRSDIKKWTSFKCSKYGFMAMWSDDKVLLWLC